jgi:hypothetical protein
MALVGKRDGRNFGYGRQLGYAGPQALRDLFGGGHYGTVKAHSDRWLAFVRWCRSEDGPGFNDARQIDRQTLLGYAGHLRQQVEQGELAITTAQLARATGMRLREAILADLPRLKHEAEQLGKINIQDGTKGGRGGATAPRWITVDDHIREALRYAEQVSPDGSRNLLAPAESYLDFQQRIIRPAREILHKHNLKGFHELRAAYACKRYEQITHHLAPINGGSCYQIDRHLDREARVKISYELGHGRIDVVSAYIGSRA